MRSSRRVDFRDAQYADFTIKALTPKTVPGRLRDGA